MKKFSLLIPVAASALLMMGCSEYLCLAPAGTTANSKLTICHATGKAGKYQLLTVKASAAEAHVKHGDFLAPAGAKKASDCVEPTTPPTDTVVTVPPVVVPPVVIPPVVIPPVVVPPVIVTPPVVVDPVVVVPPIVVDPTPGGSTGGDGSEGEEEEEGGSTGGGDDGETVSNPPPIVVPIDCLLNPLSDECLL